MVRSHKCQCFGLLTRPSIFLEGGIAACHVIWLLRSRSVRRQAKEQGKTYEEFVESCAPSDPGFVFRERVFRLRQVDDRMEQGGDIKGNQFVNNDRFL